MPTKRLTLSVQPAGYPANLSATITFNDQDYKKWKLPNTLLLCFGSMKHTVHTASAPRIEGLEISEHLARQMGLPGGIRLKASYKPSSGQLALGPLLGVMMSRSYKQYPGKPFASNTLFCEELSSAMQTKGGFVYFFTPAEIEKRGTTIQGWFYQNGWKKSSFPLPNVVYNRLTSRKLENKLSVQQFMKEVKANGNGTVFNEKYLDKTEVFSALKRDATMSAYLPESHLLDNFARLKSMCQRHKTVFIKPISGSLGKGIIRISRDPSGGYICQFAHLNGTKRVKYDKLSQFFASHKGKLTSRRYQIQQGIQLISAGQRPIDFRALVQKNSAGKWEITSIVGRIAGSNHIVSNLARGGSLTTVKAALQKSNLPSGRIPAVHAKLRKAALDIAAALEKHISYQFGELGVDLAVDASGKIGLIEVNSKPSKNDNTQLSTNKIRPSVRNLVSYIQHISGFGK